MGVALLVALSVSLIVAGGFIPSADLGRRKVDSALGGGVAVGEAGSSLAPASTPIATLASTSHVDALVYVPTNGYTYAGVALGSGSGSGTQVDAIAPSLTVTPIAIGGLSGSIQSLAFDPGNQYLYTANLYTNNVSVISTSTNRVVATIVVPEPYSVLYDPGNGWVYVTAECSTCTAHAVYTIVGTSIHATISVPGRPGMLGYDAMNQEVYVGTATSGGYGITTVAGTKTVNFTAPGAIEQWAYDPADGRMYASDTTGSSVIYMASSNLNVATIALTAPSLGVTYYPPGRSMYVTEPNSSSAPLQYLTAGATTASTPAYARGFSISPQYLIYDTVGGELFASTNNPTGASSEVYVLGSPNMTTWADRDVFSVTGTSRLTALSYDVAQGRVFVAAPSATAGSVTVLPIAASNKIWVGPDPTQQVLTSPNSGQFIIGCDGTACYHTYCVNTLTDMPNQVGGSGGVRGSYLDETHLVSSQNGLVFVSVTNQATVQVVSGSTCGSSAARAPLIANSTYLPTGATPEWLAFDPTFHVVYVSDPGTNHIWILTDSSNSSILGSISVVSPGPLAIGPTGDLFVAQPKAGTVLAFRNTTSLGTVTLPSGSIPMGLVVGPSGSHLYAACQGTDEVVLISTTSLGITGTVALSMVPTREEVVLGQVLILGEPSPTTGELMVLQPGSGTVRAQIPVGADPSAVAYDPATGYVNVANNGSNSITILDPSSWTLVMTLTDNIGPNPVSLLFSPTSDQMYVSENGYQASTPY